MFDRDVIMEAKEVLDLCRSAGLKVATAESCTGGLVSACLTDIAGSSDVVERGFVTYSNDAKMELLGVPADMLTAHGAVSEQVARAMAEGALERSHADIAVSVTGVAGPGGGTQDKPVGLVHLACARREQATDHRRMMFGDQGRQRIRILSVRTAFVLIANQIGRPSLA
ncbi:CinA family protein [Kaustia mangrovi]|uniref:CinA family protein n=1 Tax=Kaustia mangrovi TaxID=2593653 RepID=A0A7S8HAH1_9HYPH|nr:CinA family protein [Kaustia mangrovi]QPC41577.1 CinA family protein [Kaustia mangrovi]